MSQPAITFHNLTLGYNKKRNVLQHVNLSIPQGSLSAVIGVNGAGKSTLMKALMGELKSMEGDIHLHGLNQRDIAYLPQRAAFEQNFPMSIRDCVAMGLWKRIGAFGVVSAAQQEQVNLVLASVGLTDMADEALSDLSGGQIQRVLFARLILQDAPVILLDEPFNAIDEQTIHDLMSLVRQWQQQGRTVLVVLHDLELVRHYFADTLRIASGQVDMGKTTEVLAQHLQRWVA